MQFTLHVWRQDGSDAKGSFETHQVDGISPDMSFLEMLDQLNERLVVERRRPVVYEFDCREGICGTCSLVINGQPHGPVKATTTCQTYMRNFTDGQDIYIEPFRAASFPVIRDLAVDRSALDRISQAGGFISVNTGSAPDGNAVSVSKTAADSALETAACIGCGACVAACPNASASLYVAAKASHLAQLPQGDAERSERARTMINIMDQEGFGACSNHGECEAACPMEIGIEWIAKLNREFVRSTVVS